MLPEWMKTSESYVPPEDGGTFAVKTIMTIGNIMARLKIQAGHEKKRHLPAIVKLFLLIGLITATSVCRSGLVLAGIAAAILVCLCTWPPRHLWEVMRPGLLSAAVVCILFIPAMIIRPAGIPNYVTVIVKVFLCVLMTGIFNHTTQWNHITRALKKLHIPGIFIFTLDTTVKYIVLLGNLIRDLLTSMQLRAVGKHNKKYSSVGGVMGVTFLRGTEMSVQMYEAMRCRGFTDDYRGL